MNEELIVAVTLEGVECAVRKSAGKDRRPIET
jgi:hypothetical protein